MTEETYTTGQQTSKASRRQKSTSERLVAKQNQLAKAKASQAVMQKKIKGLEEEIKILENKRQQEILQEYGMSLSDLEAFLANNKDKLGGDA